MLESLNMGNGGDSFILLDAAVTEQRAQWMTLWQSWPQHDIVAHPGYAPLFARPQDRTVCACQVGEDGLILFPFIIRPLRAEPWAGEDHEACDLVSPYGYGGPFGWGAYSADGFWSAFDRWAQAARAVSLFARLSPFKDQLIPFYGDTLVKGPSVIVPLEQPADMVLRSYHKAVRENIRQAERVGVTVEVDPMCRRLEDFLCVYYSTMDRLAALPMYYFPESFFNQLIIDLPGHVVLFHALHHSRVVSSELVLIAERYLYSFLGGTLQEGLPLRANMLLRHAVNLWGREHHKQYVLLGGGYAGEDSLLRYKQRFAPNQHAEFCVGTKIFDRFLYQSLIERRTAWEQRQGRTWSPREEFFPAYRGGSSPVAGISASSLSSMANESP